MKREVNVCDECGEHIATEKCFICGKDLCDSYECSTFLYSGVLRHTRPGEWSRFSRTTGYDNKEYEESVPYDTLTLSIGTHYKYSDRYRVCPECGQTITNLFDVLGKGDNENLTKGILKKMKEIGKVEVI